MKSLLIYLIGAKYSKDFHTHHSKQEKFGLWSTRFGDCLHKLFAHYIVTVRINFNCKKIDVFSLK